MEPDTETYSFLRQFADSWMLLLLFAFFIGVVVWVFRPGSRKTYDDTADIPFRHDDKPATSAEVAGKNSDEEKKE